MLWLAILDRLAFLLVFPFVMAATKVIQYCRCCCPGVGCACHCCGPETQLCPKAPEQIILTVAGVINGNGNDPIYSPLRSCSEFSPCHCDCTSFNGVFVCEFRYMWHPSAEDCEWWAPESFWCETNPFSDPVRTTYSVRISGDGDPGPTCWDGYDGEAHPCGYRVHGSMGFNLGYPQTFYPTEPNCGFLFQFVEAVLIFDDAHAIPDLEDNACLKYSGQMSYYDWKYYPGGVPLGECCLFQDNLDPINDNGDYGCPIDVDVTFAISLVGADTAPCLNCDQLNPSQQADCGC